MIDFEDIMTGNFECRLTIEDFVESYVVCCHDYALDDEVPFGFRISPNRR